MSIQKSLVMLVTLALFSMSANAVEWSRQVELGAVYLTGNTEEDTIKLRSNISRDSEKFKQRLKFDFLRSNRDGQLSAQKFYTDMQVDYKLEGEQFTFARFSYEDDKFNGFDYQTDVVLGYGRTVLQSQENMKLDLEVGPGYRYSALESGESNKEIIVRLSAGYHWDISKTAQFEQSVSSEIGKDATITRSSTALRSQINGSLAMKLSLDLKNNSRPPLGNDETDLETAVTLIYSF